VSLRRVRKGWLIEGGGSEMPDARGRRGGAMDVFPPSSIRSALKM
jgi:hypothetical protein